MKKILLLLIVVAVAAGGALGYQRLFGSRGAQVCGRLAVLCGGQLSGERLERCAAQFDRLQEVVGKEKVTRMARCVDGAGSCIMGMGCVAGASLGATADFLKGMRQMLGGQGE